MKLEQTTSIVVDGVEVFPIPSLDGLYCISKCGRIWAVDREVWSGRAAYLRKGAWKAVFINKAGYLQVSVSNKNFSYSGPRLVHRLMAEVFLPEWKPEMEVDHVDRDRGNCRLENLRPANRSMNNRNSGPKRSPKSGFKGVHPAHKSHRKAWVAQIYCGKVYHLGYFNDPEEAARAYDAGARKHFGEFAYQNFPSEV